MPHIQQSGHSHLKVHQPAVAAFEDAIKTDPEMLDLFEQIFLQASSENQIPDFDSLLYKLDIIVVRPPKLYSSTRDDDGRVIVEYAALPIYILFDLLSNTSAAYDLFRKPAFNKALKNLLNSWGKYLTSADSNSSLTDEDGDWFSEAGLAKLDQGRGVFNETYVTPNPNAIDRGYSSWNEFFTREVQTKARPVLFPKETELVNNACESTVYRIARDVQKHDCFWLKAQPYSLYDMLGRDETVAQQLVGGTVYQAFLKPEDYHRWRSPVDGTIVRADVLPGTYYAALPDKGAPEDDPYFPPGDPRGAVVRSQAWLTASSTRAIIYVQSDNPVIGLVVFIGVGMIEVSTCAPSVVVGQTVKKGDELGMFHYGGSSHALIFGPQAKVTFRDNVVVNQHLWVNTIIARVEPA